MVRPESIHSIATLRKASVALLTLAALLAASPARACTTFLLQGGGALYFGRNLDWYWEDGIVVVNPRDVQKAAFVLPGNAPAKWLSRYGSVTFNQFGREMPFGGMNEAGLVVENMWLDETEYAPRDSRPTVNLLQWIQYQLDTCRTVAEVISNDSRLRIEPPPASAKSLARIHYLLCDSTGDLATVEFLKGAMVCHHGDSLPLHALANDPYADSLAYAQAHALPEKLPTRLKDLSSYARFNCAAARASRFNPTSPDKDLAYAFATLDQVAQGDFTVWSIVYDVRAKKIHFKTHKNPQARVLDLAALDFSCASAPRFMNIESKPADGGNFNFQQLSEPEHRQYMSGFLGRPSVKEKLGDLTMLMELQLMTIRGYRCQTAER
jgi:choloylglycine hydrolase